MDGAQGLAAALVDWDDDDDAGLRDGQGAGQAVPLVGRGLPWRGRCRDPQGSPSARRPAGAHVVQERRLPGTQQMAVGRR